MKCLNIIILLNLAGSVFGGGTSICGPIQESTAAFLQVNQAVINRTIDYVAELVKSYPEMGTAYTSYLRCYLFELINSFANGTGQNTGLDFDYVFLSLVGANQPPFIAPLDCVESDILSYLQYLQNISGIAGYLNTFIKQSPIRENTPCEEVQSFFQPFETSVPEIVNQFLSISTDAANAYNSIGKLNLYLHYHPKITECGSNTFARGFAELLQMDPSIVNAFLADQSSAIDPPLSCVEGSVSSLLSMIDDTKNQFNNIFVSPGSP